MKNQANEVTDSLRSLIHNLGVNDIHIVCIGTDRSTGDSLGPLVTDEDIYMILSVVDSNVGTSGVKGVKLFKWARMLFQPYYKPPHYPRANWILEINGRESVDERLERLNKVVEGLKELWRYDKSKVG